MVYRGYKKPGTCPRCGAVPAHQRHQISHIPPDLAECELVNNINPVDAAQCPRCQEVFQVVTYEHDDCFVFGLGKISFECVPNFCPICGKEIEYE